jgi:uncharacterized protein
LGIDLHYTLVGLLIGAMVGIIGVGGGSLMTPILITVFGISPATAVGTYLQFAAATHSLGSLVNGFNHRIEWGIVCRLTADSLPTTILALSFLSLLHMSVGGAPHSITATLTVRFF